MLVDWKAEQDEMKEILGDEYMDYNLVMASTFGLPLGDGAIRGPLKKLIEDYNLPPVAFRTCPAAPEGLLFLYAEVPAGNTQNGGPHRYQPAQSEQGTYSKGVSGRQQGQSGLRPFVFWRHPAYCRFPYQPVYKYQHQGKHDKDRGRGGTPELFYPCFRRCCLIVTSVQTCRQTA